MTELTLDQVGEAYSEIEKLAQALSDAPSVENAAVLRAKCRRFATLMRGRYGNVAEQLGRISEVARRFEKSRIDLTEARSDLQRAVARMDIAIDIHRHGIGGR